MLQSNIELKNKCNIIRLPCMFMTTNYLVYENMTPYNSTNILILRLYPLVYYNIKILENYIYIYIFFNLVFFFYHFIKIGQGKNLATRPS